MSKAILTFVVHQHGRFARRETLTRPLIRIGRDRQCHIVLDDAAAAARHVLIEVSDSGSITLVHTGGDKQTAVNGAQIEEVELSVGDRISIGYSELVLEQIVRDGISAQEAAPPAARLGKLWADRDLAGPSDGELAHVLAAEVTIAWGENVLHVAHLTDQQSFYVGDDPHQPSDFLIPSEKLGAARLPLVLGGGKGITVVIPAQARGFVEGPSGVRVSLTEARAYGSACPGLPGARQLVLALGTRAQLEFGDIVFRVAAVFAGKPVPHGLVSGIEAGSLAYLGLSALSVGGFLSSLAFLAPPLGLTEEEELDPERLYLLRQYLDATSERERKPEPGEGQATPAPAPQSAARAEGEAGALGRPDTTAKDRRMGVQGTAKPEEVQLSRHDALKALEQDLMIGLLNRGAAGDPDAPTVPWGADAAIGADDRSARGDLWSKDIGDIAGLGGLAPTGSGIGGGGRSKSIGLNEIGTIGDNDRGLIDGRGRFTRGHRTNTPRIRPVDTQVSGRLPAQTIQRIVRQNHPRFRACYERGLASNPTLEGRVGVRFVIGRDGAVTHASNAGSDLPNPEVINCVTRAFYDIGFPRPDTGVVTVVYPIMFSAD